LAVYSFSPPEDILVLCFELYETDNIYFQWFGSVCFALMNFGMDNYVGFIEYSKVLACDQVFTTPLYITVLLSMLTFVDIISLVVSFINCQIFINVL
jgi:hypothetical protein